MTLVDIHNNLVSRIEGLGQGFSADFNLKLERIEHLLELMGNPERDFRVVHVAGTSGKGTVSTLVSEALRLHGVKTGLFTSPYLQVINESWVVDGRRIDIQFMAELVDEIWPLVEQVDRDGEFGLPSYSEVLLAVGFLAFSRLGVEVAVIEAFLGGKLDATNVVSSDVSVLVSVGLDHIEILGNSIEEIALDKVQIMEPGCVSVCGFVQESAQHIAQQNADRVGGELWIAGRDLSYEMVERDHLSIRNAQFQHVIETSGELREFQRRNIVCAVAACDQILGKIGRVFSAPVFSSSMTERYLPGRNEVIQDTPLVVLDGAHNSEKVSGALEVIGGELEDRKVAVVYAAKKSFSSDASMLEELRLRQKRIFAQLAALGPAGVWMTKFSNKGIWRAESPEFLKELYDECSSRPEALIDENAVHALGEAIECVGKSGLVLVLGSFHLVGEIRDIYEPRETLLKNQ